eukprot:12203560-Ditylum_brightwellii.AAC.1
MYGNMTPYILQTLQDNAKAMNFDPIEPVDTIFSKIDDLADITELAKDPISEKQKIFIGYIIHQQAHKFASNLTKWNNKPDTQKTWANFQSHFQKAQKDLHRSGNLTVEYGINHTEMINMVAE